jgi:hypothetical protein
MKVEMGKKYISNGQLVRILCIDGYDADCPVVVMYKDGTVRYFTENGINADDKRELWDLVEAFEPQEGELCWFWDVKRHEGVVLSKFVKMVGERFLAATGWDWRYCSKFDGTPPKHLKGL